MKDEIGQLLKKALGEIGMIGDVPLLITRPEDSRHGDYATNVAMMLSKKFASAGRRNPMEIAQEIQKAIIKHQKASTAQMFSKVEIVPPGFINLFLSEANLINQLGQVLTQGDGFGITLQPQNLRRNTASGNIARKRVYPDPPAGGRRVMVEFSDTNPFKEFHIGHLRNITLGESFSRLLEATGHEVRRVSYQGDVGMHVAKALWGLQLSVFSSQLSKPKTPKEKAELLGKAYAAGSKAFEDPSADGEEAKKEIIEINKKVYRKDASIIPLWEEGRQWSLDYFDTIYDRLDTNFTRFYFESEVSALGAAIVADHIKDGIFEESEGAVIFRGEKVGLHTRVFISKEGYATYEAKDLALAPLKYSEYPYDLSIIMTGNEQTEYFRVMLAALKLVRPDLAEKTKHISFGMVQLTEGKMSSRSGNVITADWLIDSAKNRIYNILQKSESKYSKELQEEIAEKAAIAAVKYSMLKVTVSSDIAFDLVKSVSFEGDSGPYLQYTYARCRSVLRKAQNDLSHLGDLRNLSDLEEKEERELARLITYFPEIFSEAAENFAPNTVCTYLFGLAQAFNLLYAKHEILGSGVRLTLTAATSHVLKNGLYLLGIEVLEHM